METMKSQKVTVTILKEGYAYLDEEGYSRANASCTLVKTPNCLVIIDTLTPWDGPFILEKLAELNIKPASVTHVISTHGHSDHCGNNNLFLEAKQHIVGYCISNKDVYHSHPFEHDEPFILDEYLSIIPTPGHTNEDVSLLVNLSDDKQENPEEMLIIAGDLFECEQDILNPYIWTPNSSRPEIQVKNRLKALKLAKKIIPGHGKLFDVTKEHLEAAEELVKKYEKDYP